MKRLLIIGAGIEQMRAYQLAREMRLEVVGTDRNPDAPALPLAHHRLLVSTRDVTDTVEQAIAFAERYPLHGVMTIANDVPHTVAAVAQALGLPGIPLESAALTVDKLAMKRCLAAAGVAVPDFREVTSPAELRQAIEALGLPAVIKPVDNCGARGVLRLTEGIDLDEALATARGQSYSGRVMVERYLEGMQISTESVVLEGEVHTPAFSERNYEYLERFAPHIVENGGTMPAPIDNATRAAVDRLLTEAAAALGIRNGILKGDVVLGPDGPALIEVATRLSGGYFCTHQTRLSTGVDLVAAAIRLALGETVTPEEVTARYHRPVAIRYLFTPPGRVVAVNGLDALLQAPGVVHGGIYLEPGETVPPVTHHAARAGFAIAEGTTREEAIARANAALSRVTIDLEGEASGSPA